ncbi:MAG: FAD-binding oxidoreductase [Candidatus Thorarchaeota archaeon]
MEKKVIDRLTAIVGEDNIVIDTTELSEYSGNPACVVKPTETEQAQQIVKLANEHRLHVIPTSSGLPRLRGQTSAKGEDTVIVDLRLMKRILRVDTKNRVVTVEPGVTFEELIHELDKNGLLPLMPLLPKASQSVLASALDQEPITTPRFHWDSPDPLLCTETIFGNGDLFRTGSAAGPGTLEEQWASGQAQKNPMGPSQFDPYRIIQGSQGTIGIVTWASIKCETKPKNGQLLLAPLENLEDLVEFTYIMLRRKLADDLFIMNALSLSSAMNMTHEEISEMERKLPEWTLILSFAGRGLMAQEELDYRVADSRDIATANGLTLTDSFDDIPAEEVKKMIGVPCPEQYWKLRYKGACKEVFFLTTLDLTSYLYSEFLNAARENRFPADSIGVYLQPTIQGTNTHCFFDIYYDSQDSNQSEAAEALFQNGSMLLMDKGAYFSRPVPAIAGSVFSRSSPENISAMKRVKSIFDANLVMSPDNLCFEEVRE